MRLCVAVHVLASQHARSGAARPQHACTNTLRAAPPAAPPVPPAVARQVAALQTSNVVVMYASAYGNTAALAQAVSRGITKGGVAVSTLNLELSSLDEVVAAVKAADGFTIGSPTLGGHMPTPVQVRRCMLRCAVLCCGVVLLLMLCGACTHAACIGCGAHACSAGMLTPVSATHCCPCADASTPTRAAPCLPPACPPASARARLHPARLWRARAAVRRVWQLWLERRGGG